ncbi:hypothetical protein [Streptomyces sp. NPDC052727]|uniref:hypothetical protein n=1 Tax=unclassified Streptomyces TaxID=2593676 RepID=UPI00342E6F08
MPLPQSMTDHATAESTPSPHAARLVGLTTALDRCVTTGEWAPTALERSLARRLAVGSAGGLQPTPALIRSVLWEGNIPLCHENEGRLASLLGLSLTVAESAEPDRAPALTRVRELLERLTERTPAPATRPV